MKTILSLLILIAFPVLSRCQSFHYKLPDKDEALSDNVIKETDVELINMVTAVDVKFTRSVKSLRFLLTNEQGDTLIGHKGFIKVTPKKYRLSLSDMPDGWYYINFVSGTHHFVKMFYYGQAR